MLHSSCKAMIVSKIIITFSLSSLHIQAIAQSPQSAAKSTTASLVHTNSPKIPRELIFQIGFLGLEGRGNKATLLKIDLSEKANGKSQLGPFLKLADLESTRLTLIANGISVSKAHTDPRSRENLFRVLKKTRKLDILAVAPRIANSDWTFIWGDADAPITRTSTEDLDDTPSPIVAAAALREVFKHLGFNALIFRTSNDRAQVLTPLAGNLRGAQVVAFTQAANSSRNRTQMRNTSQPKPQDEDLSAIVTLMSQNDNGVYDAEVVISDREEWSKTTFVRGFVAE
jgi:hypothetical protein